MRVEEVKNVVAKQGSFEELAEAMRRVEIRQGDTTQELRRVEDRLSEQSSNTWTILASVQGMSHTISEMKQMLTGLGQAVANLRVLSTNHRFFQCPTNGSIAFEDPFGQIDPLPLGWVNSWEVRQPWLRL